MKIVRLREFESASKPHVGFEIGHVRQKRDGQSSISFLASAVLKNVANCRGFARAKEKRATISFARLFFDDLKCVDFLEEIAYNIFKLRRFGVYKTSRFSYPTNFDGQTGSFLVRGFATVQAMKARRTRVENEIQKRSKIMLKGISKLLSPSLLKILAEMGHGDEIVIADGNFPSENYGKRVIRADGIGGKEMLDAILSVIPLDTYAETNYMLMATTQGDPTPPIWAEYREIAQKWDKNVREKELERYEFYDRAKTAYAVIATGESAIYANIILKKGVI